MKWKSIDILTEKKSNIFQVGGVCLPLLLPLLLLSPSLLLLPFLLLPPPPSSSDSSSSSSSFSLASAGQYTLTSSSRSWISCAVQKWKENRGDASISVGNTISEREMKRRKGKKTLRKKRVTLGRIERKDKRKRKTYSSFVHGGGGVV